MRNPRDPWKAWKSSSVRPRSLSLSLSLHVAVLPNIRRDRCKMLSGWLVIRKVCTCVMAGCVGADSAILTTRRKETIVTWCSYNQSLEGKQAPGGRGVIVEILLVCLALRISASWLQFLNSLSENIRQKLSIFIILKLYCCPLKSDSLWCLLHISWVKKKVKTQCLTKHHAMETYVTVDV
jgi:hypothetical protein